MKKILFALSLLALVTGFARADEIVTLTVTVTNFAGIQTNGTSTLVVNADTRTGTNIITASPSTFFFGTNSMLPAKSNLFDHLRLYPYGSAGTRLTLIDNATNSFKLRGQVNQAISASAGGVWGTVSLATNTVTNFTAVVVPGTYYTAAEGTNVASGMSTLLTLASNQFPNGAQGWTNLVDLTSFQRSSNKTFWATTNFSGLLDGMRITNALAIWGSNGTLTAITLLGSTNSGWIGSLTNGTLYSNTMHWTRITNVVGLAGTVALLKDGVLTNAILDRGFATNFINYGNAIRSEGSGENSLQVGSNALALGSLSMAIGNGAIATSSFSMAVGIDALASNIASVAIGQGAKATNDYAAAVGYSALAGGGASVSIGPGASAFGEASIAIGQDAVASDNYSIVIGSGSATAAAALNLAGETASAISAMAVGFGATSSHSNSAAIGPRDHLATGTATTTTNQIVLGTANHRTYIPGTFNAVGISNLITIPDSTNVIRGDWSTPWAASSSIANGANRLNMLTNALINLSGSPSADWTLDSIIYGIATPRDGLTVKLRNSTGQNATIAHESGLEATTAYRITTATSTNVIFTNAATAELIYSATSSRWILWDVFDGHEPTMTATATNAIAFRDGSGTNLTIYGGTIASNLTYSYSAELIATNGSANSNLTVAFGSVGTSTRELFITNNISLTNMTGLAAGAQSSVQWRIVPTLVNRTVVYPTLGGNQFGVHLMTNANNPIWTTLTNGQTYRLLLSSWGTNIDVSISEWK